MLKVMSEPIDGRDVQLDLKCFPDIYCYGEIGIGQKRHEKVTDSEYVKTLLKLLDSRFRLHPQFLFHLRHLANIRQLNAGIFTKMNVTDNTSNLTAGLSDKFLKSGELEKKSYIYFSAFTKY